MLHKSIPAIAGLVFLFAGSQAMALQVTNRDTSGHKLVVTENDATQELTVQPSEMIEDICNSGCTIKMSDGEEYQFDGTEVVSIEEGLLFLDGPGDGLGADIENAEPADAASDEPQQQTQ